MQSCLLFQWRDDLDAHWVSEHGRMRLQRRFQSLPVVDAPLVAIRKIWIELIGTALTATAMGQNRRTSVMLP